MGGRSGQGIGRQQQQQQQQQQQNGTQDYNATVIINGRNQFPQYSTEDMISFTGIPKDFKGGIRIEYNDDGAKVYISGEGVSMTRDINLYDKEVSNEYFKIERSSIHYGRGAEIFNNQVQSVKSAGFERIKVYAAGSHDDNQTYNGYYTWARFGYVPNNEQLGVTGFNQFAQQNNIGQVSNFKEIMYTKQGRDWWQNKAGVSFRGTFDLTDNSYSMTTLNNYMQERANR
jgi:hypothetical protein